MPHLAFLGKGLQLGHVSALMLTLSLRTPNVSHGWMTWFVFRKLVLLNPTSKKHVVVFILSRKKSSRGNFLITSDKKMGFIGSHMEELQSLVIPQKLHPFQRMMIQLVLGEVCLLPHVFLLFGTKFFRSWKSCVLLSMQSLGNSILKMKFIHIMMIYLEKSSKLLRNLVISLWWSLVTFKLNLKLLSLFKSLNKVDGLIQLQALTKKVIAIDLLLFQELLIFLMLKAIARPLMQFWWIKLLHQHLIR